MNFFIDLDEHSWLLGSLNILLRHMSHDHVNEARSHGVTAKSVEGFHDAAVLNSASPCSSRRETMEGLESFAQARVEVSKGSQRHHKGGEVCLGGRNFRFWERKTVEALKEEGDEGVLNYVE